MSEKLLNIAVLGTGEWARTYHLPALKYLESRVPLQIAGIWNRTREKAVETAREFSIERVYKSLEEAIDDERLDCFCVLVNPRVIPEIIEKLLSRNIAIFAEKSPGRSYREAQHLADNVAVPNVVAFNRRYMPINQQYKALVDSLRNIYFVECHFYRHERLYKEFILETGVHGINCMEYLFGPITKVQTERWKNPVNDTAVFLCQLQFDSGLRGIMKFFPCSGSSIERYEAHCNGTSAYLFSPQTYSSDYPGRIVIHREGKHEETVEGDDRLGMIINAGFVNEYLDFINALRTGQPGISNFSNAANTMRVAEAVESSLSLDLLTAK
ncbi:MAG: Gfo/Idh/MocA family oxidoreductase [Spirochaetaceae bacterium]|nr:MAG: Gfo/Idh/MocA family oxidoreductase [Spirochaetaceae bacterium]